MKKKNANFIMLLVIAILMIIILLIVYKPSSTVGEETIKCISENSHLYVSKTCGHCAQQEQILGDSLILFTITDCADSPQECINADIQYFPTWIINGEKYKTVLEIQELRRLTGC